MMSGSMDSGDMEDYVGREQEIYDNMLAD